MSVYTVYACVCMYTSSCKYIFALCGQLYSYINPSEIKFGIRLANNKNP